MEKCNCSFLAYRELACRRKKSGARANASGPKSAAVAAALLECWVLSENTKYAFNCNRIFKLTLFIVTMAIAVFVGRLTSNMSTLSGARL